MPAETVAAQFLSSHEVVFAESIAAARALLAGQSFSDAEGDAGQAASASQVARLR